jgi:hypothetical protein
MAIRSDTFTRLIDCTTTTGVNQSAPFVVGVGPYLSGSFQAANETDTSWASGVITVECSNDGRVWQTIPSYILSASTITADGISNLMDLSGVMFLRFRVTTSESTLMVRITFCGKGDS